MAGASLAGAGAASLLLHPEAAANAMEHAYGSSADGTLDVATFVEADSIVVEITDRGTWRPPVESDRVGGRGLPIMRAVMDEVHIERTPAGTTVRMTRKRSPSGV